MIKLIVTDCDGVLTPDHKWYTQAGELIKRFSTKDTTAIRYIEQAYHVPTIVLSGDDRVNAEFCALHRLEFVHAVHNKAESLKEISARHGVPLTSVLFIGDDLPDLEAGKLVQHHGGLFCCPQDASLVILQEASMIPVNGGDGVISRLYADRRHLFTERKHK